MYYPRKHINWAEAQEIFIRGMINEQGVPINVTITDIARKFGVSKQTVFKMKEKHGWEQKRTEYQNTLFLEDRKRINQLREDLINKSFIPPDIPENLFQMKMQRTKFVYIFSYGDKVKIGRSYNPDSRLKAIQHASPFDIKMVHAEQETDDINEKLLHQKFKKYKIDREFFFYTSEIKQFLIERGGYVK